MCSMVDRDKKLTVRASDDEIAMMQALADADGVSSSDVVRQFIRREYRARGLGDATKPTKAKPTKAPKGRK